MIKLTQYLFSRNEISRLSNLFSSPHLAGFDATYLQVPNLDEEKVASVLCARGVLEKNQNSQFSLNPSLTPLFETLFRPERVLLVVRDVPAAGTQQVVFLIRQNMIILHAQPEQESHSLSMISVDEMVGLIEEWFSEYRGDTALNAQLRIPFTEFEHVRKISEQGESEQAKNLLKAHTDANDETADNLITQMQTRKVSASFMFFEVNGEKAHDLETFAMFTGSSTQWVVTEDPANHDLIVFCSKESFNSEVQKIIGKFYKKKDSGLN